MFKPSSLVTALTIVITVVAVASPPTALAQSLDEEVERLLTDDCFELGLLGGSDTGGAIGPNLDAICRFNTPTAVASTGGGAVSSPSASTTLQGQKALDRVEEERDEGDSASLWSIVKLFDIDGLGLWSSLEYTKRKREATRFEGGFNSDVWGVVTGVDYRIATSLFMGAAFNYRNIKADLEGGGNFETDSYGGVVYGSFTPTPEAFIDVAVGYGKKEYEVERDVLFDELEFGEVFRSISGRASSDTDGRDLSVNMIAGYSHAIGNIVAEPRAGINYLRTNVDGYRESGDSGLELDVRKDKSKSLQSVLGFRGAIVASTPFGVVTPSASFDWIHEFENDQRRRRAHFLEDLRDDPLVFSFETEKPDRNFFQLNIGASIALPRGVSAFALYRRLLGHRHFESTGVTVGFRFEPSRLIQ
jgi:outer membrane autotransporter protein